MIHFTYTVRVILAVVLLLYFPSITEAQVSIYASDHTVQPEESFTVDVTAQGFQNILGCQFSVSWDSEAFEFRGAENLNQAFLDYPFDHFSFVQASQGRLGFLWFDNSLAGISIEDDEILFSVRLKALQEESGAHAFSFGGEPTAIEVADTAENVLNVEFFEGSLIIEGVSNIRNKNRTSLVQINSAPNPFKEQTQVDIHFLHSAPAHITIHDVLGATLYQESANYQSGPYRLNFSRDIFPQPGTYILEVRSEGILVAHKLIVI
ncbi:MAG: T9SS type A sorting domain-containing protein [Phaeodactylibacter sp.]|nr:T9SS type A sorting domain-containing protein [Phaeodactylibacter sp.]